MKHRRAAAALAALLAAGAAAAQRAPNIVLIVADDLGSGDLSSYGGTVVRTPNIDRLAREGVRFERAYAAAAVCSPSRAGLLTGQHPARQGYDFNPMDRTVALARETATLPEVIKAGGYRTGMVGKWHLGGVAGSRPNERGFDEFFGSLGGAGQHIDPAETGVETWTPEPIEGRMRTILRGTEPVEEKEYLTDAYTREALSFIERHRDQPFFLYLAYYAPHAPLQATARHLEPYRHIAEQGPRIYAAMVHALDLGVGAILDRLDQLALASDTLVIFVSDNGCPLYLGGACSNGILRGGKRYFFEGGVRVPLLARFPGRVRAGQVFGAPVSLLDLFPTAVAAARGAAAVPPGLDGVNLLPVLAGGGAGAAPHPALYWRAGANFAVSDGRHKLWLVNRASEAQRASIEPERLLPDFERRSESPQGQLALLYDLEADPRERNNLAAAEEDTVERLQAQLRAWQAGIAAPRFPSRRATVATIDGVPVEIVF